MATPTEQQQPEPDQALKHALDQMAGVVPSQVRPAPPHLAKGILGGAALLFLLLWQVFSVNVGLSLVLAFVGFLVASYLLFRSAAGARVAVDQVMRGLISGAFVLALLPLISLLWTVIDNGAHRLFSSSAFVTQTMNGVFGLHDQAYVAGEGPFIGGAYHAIIGTLIITGIAMLISVPIGLFTAIYLVEYSDKNRLGRVVRFLVDVMTGIPSIVAGLFAFALFAVLFSFGTQNGFAGAVALSVLMIPTVVRNSEEMLRIVPNELREAALALGVPKWRVIAKVVLPTAASGLASGVTLAISRVIGETAPLLVAVGATKVLNLNPGDGPMNTLAVFAYDAMKTPISPGAAASASYERAWAAALLLLLLVVALNLTARMIAKVFAPKTGR